MYKINIKNTVGADKKRTYCAIALPPNVSDVAIDDVLVPVIYTTDNVLPNAQESIKFQHEYFAFVGKLDKSGTIQQIESKMSVPVKLGSAQDNGQIIEAYFDDASIGIKEANDQTQLAAQGSFMISCRKRPPPGIKHTYVVGLAQRLADGDEDSDPVPIAAMRYVEKKDYTIQPSRKICICGASMNMKTGVVVNHSQKVAVISFPVGRSEVAVAEDGNEDFTTSGQKIPKKTLTDLVLGVRPAQSNHPFQFAYSQPKAKTAGPPPKWKAEADALGLNSLTQIAENDDLRDEFLDDLLVLALFRCILFLDNSKSIDWEPERGRQRRDISANIVSVETIYENTDDVRVEFLNGDIRGDRVSTAAEVTQLLDDITNFGRTPIGTELDRKILSQYVYPPLAKRGKFHPMIISIITDGDPQGEPRDTLKKKIQACKEKLNDREKTLVGDKHVLFQISRVGSDSGAVKFINDLKSDPELKKILHCTSYQHLDFEPDADDPVNTYAPAVTRLAGAAFVGLKRNAKGVFEFPEN